MVTLKYEVNGGGLQTWEPITGVESVQDFIGLKQGSNGGNYPTHGYGIEHEVLIFLYHNTDSDRYSLIFQMGEGYLEDEGMGIRCDFTENMNPAEDILVENGQGRNNPDYFDHAWGIDEDSGDQSSQSGVLALKANTFRDATFTISQSVYDFSQQDAKLPNDFGIITSDGSTPTGGGVDFAGVGGSIRIKMQGLPPFSGGNVVSGDQVIMLQDDLAVHGL